MTEAIKHQNAEIDVPLPHYKGPWPSWLYPELPREARDWTYGGDKSFGEENGDRKLLLSELDRLTKRKLWTWPKRPILFFSDLHADRKAFVASLVASGGVRRTGPGVMNFRLTNLGKQATFIIGGDCFDKGPHNLKLLRAVRRLIELDARVRILAGNHDVRNLLGMQAVNGDADEKVDHRNDHFFLRLGPKVVPLLVEIRDSYLTGRKALADIPEEDECRRRLFPHPDWFDAFPKIAADHLPKKQIDVELKRIKKKMVSFEPACAEAGLSMRQVYAAVLKWRELFLQPDGEFHWFFKRMRLGYHVGSFMFVHAGFDDAMADLLHADGVKALNRQFRDALFGEPFDLYYGSIANTVRTKHRTIDNHLSPEGAQKIHDSGIHAIIHGHRNLLDGQRIMLRRGLINFECDSTIDQHSRHKEGLKGSGAAVTIVHPEGHILGISTDFPYAKAFEPKRTLTALSSALLSDDKSAKANR
ncbi:metallophosphoesterase [Thalassospira sp. HF15]|uniref:metallophosphoesterase n=1 Tax=Thalassospira sp. HF15 TaxID=2722755 RepID=UPI001431FC1E|nr:metallophosphoesterase [Thalassospira sp. HF15]NIY74862.1 metallophosphoesterase [Thalassospira sp. HF15]